MGSGESKPRTAEEEHNHKIAAQQRLEQQRQTLEEELKRKQKYEKQKMEEQQRQQEEAEMQRKLENERLEQRNEKEKEHKQLEYKHLEEMKRIEIQGQEQMLQILKETFGKVKELDINQAVYSAYIMQCIHTGKSIDMQVLEAVASKVPTPPPPNLVEIVENVIEKCNEEYDDGYSKCQSALSTRQ